MLLQASTDVFDDKQRSEHDFFEYVAKSYKYFLAGDDYQSQAVDDEIAQEAEDRAEEVRQRNQQLQQVSPSSSSAPGWYTDLETDRMTNQECEREVSVASAPSADCIDIC